MTAARELLAEPAVLHSYEPPELRGDHVGGLDEFLEWYGEKRRLAGPEFGYEVDELLGGERHAVALLRLYDMEREWRQAAVYRVENGRIVEIWLYEDPHR